MLRLTVRMFLRGRESSQLVSRQIEHDFWDGMNCRLLHFQWVIFEWVGPSGGGRVDGIGSLKYGHPHHSEARMTKRLCLLVRKFFSHKPQGIAAPMRYVVKPPLGYRSSFITPLGNVLQRFTVADGPIAFWVSEVEKT